MDDLVSCDLIENALDYLILAGEQANEGSERMLKHSLATLADGIELLLKARLEIDGWHLLFEDIDKADQDKLDDGDFVSVSYKQSMKRLKDICSVDIEKKHQTVIEKLRKLRNKIRHFAIDTNRQEVVSLITKSYSFAIDFVTQHLESHYGDEIREELDTLRRMLGEFDEFVNSRLQEIQQTLQSQDFALHVECPKCTQETLYPSEEHSVCAFCGYDEDGEKTADELIKYHFPWKGPKERMIDEDVEACPECGKWACIYNETHNTSICMSCGESGNYQHCNICGQLYSGEPNPGNRCDGCWDELMSKD